MSNYPLATSTWNDKELQAIQSVVDKDIYSMSNSVAQFEQDFSGFIDRKYCVMTSSGSTANLIATAALFLCSPASSYVSGEILVVDGAYTTR